MLVRIVKVPGGTAEVTVDDGATVGEVLEAYGQAGGFQARSPEGDDLPDDATLKDSVIYLAKMIKGN